jgi:hypothetical protein
MWFVVKGGWPQMILLFLIMRCTPTIRELIEATPLSPSSPSATSLSALAPAQRAGAQRLCVLARCGHAAATTACLLLGDERTYLRRGPRSEFGPKVSQALTFHENCLRSA